MSKLCGNQLTVAVAENGYVIRTGSILNGELQPMFVAENAATLADIVSDWAVEIDKARDKQPSGQKE